MQSVRAFSSVATAFIPRYHDFKSKYQRKPVSSFSLGYTMTGYRHAVTPPNSSIFHIVSSHEVEETYCFGGHRSFEMILHRKASFQPGTPVCPKVCKNAHNSAGFT